MFIIIIVKIIILTTVIRLLLISRKDVRRLYNSISPQSMLSFLNVIIFFFEEPLCVKHLS